MELDCAAGVGERDKMCRKTNIYSPRQSLACRGAGNLAQHNGGALGLPRALRGPAGWEPAWAERGAGGTMQQTAPSGKAGLCAGSGGATGMGIWGEMQGLSVLSIGLTRL